MIRARACLLLAAAFVLPGLAQAQQAWPTAQPIKVIVPFSAGSATDIIARLVMEQVGSQIGQTYVVDNRVGRRRHHRRGCGRESRSRRLHHPDPFLDAYRGAGDQSVLAL